MPRGCVFNELCLGNLCAHAHRAEDLFNQLFRILDRVGGRFRVPSDFFQLKLGNGQPLRAWLSRCLEIGGQDRDAARRRAFSLDTQEVATLESAVYPSLDMKGEQPLVGLAVAYRDGELGVSLDLSGWQQTWIPIYLDCAGPWLVRHATTEDHLKEHDAWLLGEALRVHERLRLRIVFDGKKHKLASEYKRHVEGADNQARKWNARYKTRGQYLQELDGVPVDDAKIQSWEEDIIARACRGDADLYMHRHGSDAFHIYARMPHIIGYLGDASAAETCWMRVEWSSGEVHSHPREPTATVP